MQPPAAVVQRHVQRIVGELVRRLTLEPLAPGHVVDGCYRVVALLHESPRATIYTVTHTRFEGAPLVLKVVPLDRSGDFERDTNALATLTTPAVARVCDRGVLPDGRPYRVVEQLTGKTLAKALETSAFTEDRVMELLVDLAAAVFEARGNGIGPCDLSVDNLMFAAEGARRLCMLRMLAEGARVPDPEADQIALVALRNALERGRETAMTTEWKPPSSLDELRRAKHDTGGPPSPAVFDAGYEVTGGWRVLKLVAESLLATVYTVVGPTHVRATLKIAGPNADRAAFEAEARLLARVKNRHVVRVYEVGTHEGAPFYVMKQLVGRPLAIRLEESGKLAIDVALAIVDDLLDGAEAIGQAGGGPSDFSLAQCFESETEDGHPVVLTQTTAKSGRFMFFAGGRDDHDSMDAWSAAVAFYELVSGRSPFPVSRRSLMQAWLGMPVPLAERRRDVPPDISLAIHQLIAGTVTMKRRELRARILDWRKGFAQPLPIDRVSIEPPLARPLAVVPTSLSPGQARPADIQPSLDWKLEISPSRCPIAPLTAAAIRADGSEIVAVSADAFARYRRGKWSVDPSREVGRVGRLVPIGDTDYLALTADRRLFRLGPTGGFKPWAVTLARYAFFGVAPFDDGRDSAYLVGGSIDWGRGMVARLDGESITLVAEDIDVHTLFAVATVPDRSLIAVGARGSIARLRGGAVVETGHACEEDLYAVGISGSDILVAGKAARMFRVKTASLGVDVEPVDTTGSITCIAARPDVDAWAGTDHGRILRRRDRRWRRMNQPFPGQPGVVALQATSTNMRALLADGTVVLGQPLSG